MSARRVLSYSLLGALTALPLLQGCTQPAGEEAVGEKSAALVAEDKDPSFDPLDPTAKAAGGLVTQTLEIGDGWRKVRVTGNASDLDTGAPTTVDRTLIVVQDKSKIATAPVPTFVKTDVSAELAAVAPATAPPIGVTKGGFVVSKRLPAPDDDVLIVDSTSATTLQAQIDSGAPTAMYLCDDYDKTLSKTVSTTKTYGENKSFGPGDFTGTFNGTASLTASATAKAVIHVKKKWCVPYGVSFKYAQITGNATVAANGHLDGAFAKSFHYEKTIAQPSLGSLSFTIGPIPVQVNFSAPIRLGLDGSAKATVKFDGAATTHATFDMICKSSGCSGSKSATMSYPAGAGVPSMSADGLVEATPYAYAGIHANLYTDWVANAEVGIKAKLRNQLWGYAGNTCGDANGDGTNEFVNAAVLDSRFGVDLVGKVSLVGHDYGPWTYGILDTHVKYWDLMSGGSTAVSPLLSFNIPTPGGTTVNAQIRMRPCWPWTDAMKYDVAWGDGATTQTSYVAANSLAVSTHTFATIGRKTVTATPALDVMGRGPGKPSSRGLWLMPVFNTDIADVTEVYAP
jgi:hypothetical protein